VLARERPDALLPTLGGQTALNLSMQLAEAGILDDLGVELIGAGSTRSSAPRTASSSARRCARWAARPDVAHRHVAGRPRRRLAPGRDPPAFTSAATAAVCVTTAELSAQVETRPAESPIGQVLVEESVAAGTSSSSR
jgi:carbamoyl-phosphate synthase large subunit